LLATFGPINSPDIVSQSAMRQQSRFARLLASVAVTAIFTAGLGGCQTMSDITGSITSKAEPAATPETDPRRAVDVYGERYRANPKDPDAALAYGQALRATGQRAQAVAVFEQATIGHPSNKALLAGFGRALVDNGNFQQAFDVLSRAHSPDNPDWRILSVQGTALDQLGRHDEARRYYASALKIVPEEPSVLSNLGLSYVLSKDLPKAEEVLRRAYAGGKADARVRQNLGLVVGLQGRFGEAETIVKADLPAEQAAANVAYLKEMLNRKDNPRVGNGSIPVASFGDRRTE
jgi:Flp pilus assembly protein TadD